jgi:hypothetical protein
MTTSHQGSEIRRRYLGNSGAPTEVVGVPDSGTIPFGAAYIDVLPYGPLVGAYYHGSVGTGYTGGYMSAVYATATPAGPISEKTKSPEQIAFENRKARLISAVNAMKRSAPNWYGSSTTVDELSAQNAENFLRCLPGNVLLPRVAPDGEGDIMFVWDGPDNPSCVVTVEKQTLHLAARLGTPHVKQVDDQRFLGVRIPPEILAHIPSK